jgi:hypothetical protein
MMRNIIYWIAGFGSLGLLFFEAPSGSLLTTTPDRGKVERDKSGKTVRRGVPVFIWMGGGYHGGK